MRVVIFGLGDFASLIWFLLGHDSPHDVVGFTADAAYVSRTTLHALPVVAFEEVEKHFPPESVAMIAPLGVRDMNGLRAEKYRAGKTKGYQFISYVSSRAVTYPDLSIGENCMLYETCVVQPFARIGNGVVLRSGANVSHHVEVGDNCFIAGSTSIGGRAKIRERCFLGLNSTIRDRVTIAPRCFITASALVVQDTEENSVYFGVPARRRPEPADTFKAF